MPAIVMASFPVVILLLSFFGLWLSVKLGIFVRVRQGSLQKDERDDFNAILGATLTLLGLIIGFSFSMALSRYDLRKNYEEAEANAIGTEYLRVDLLPANTAAKIRELLKKYVTQRIQFYESRDRTQLEQINRYTAQLQNELWSAVRAEAAQQPTPVAALVVSGMNDVLNSQGYTQAAWWNRIPFGAWCLMGVIAAFSSALIGNGAHTARNVLFPVFSLLIAMAFFFIADLDSPRGGLIHVYPQNLVSLRDSLNAP